MAKRAKPSPRSKAAASSDFQVEDENMVESTGGLESALVLVTFLALLVALVLSQLELSSSYGQGWL